MPYGFKFYSLNIQIFWTKKIKKHSYHNFGDLFLDEYGCENWFMKPNGKDLIDLLSMLPLEGDEKEVKEET